MKADSRYAVLLLAGLIMWASTSAQTPPDIQTDSSNNTENYPSNSSGLPTITAGSVQFAVINLDYPANSNQSVNPLALTDRGSVFFSQGNKVYKWNAGAVIPVEFPDVVSEKLSYPVFGSVNNNDEVCINDSVPDGSPQYMANGIVSNVNRAEVWSDGGVEPYTAYTGSDMTVPFSVVNPPNYDLFFSEGNLNASDFVIDDYDNIYGEIAGTWIYRIGMFGVVNDTVSFEEFDHSSATNLGTALVLTGESVDVLNEEEHNEGYLPEDENFQLIFDAPNPESAPFVPGAANGNVIVGDGAYSIAGSAPISINGTIDGLNTLGEMVCWENSPSDGLVVKTENLTNPSAEESDPDPKTGIPPTGILKNGDIYNGFAGEWNNLHQIVGGGEFWQKGVTYKFSDLIGPHSGWSNFSAEAPTPFKVINDSRAIIGTATSAVDGKSHGVLLVPFSINASIQNGMITVNIPDLGSGSAGTLDVIFMNGKNNNKVTVCTKQNQTPGPITLNLDDILTGSKNVPLKPLDNQDASIFDGVCCRWRVGPFDMTTGEAKFDVPSVEVLAKRIISNYFSPTWGGTWGGTARQKGVYPAGNFPTGLYTVTTKGHFLDALDPADEGLAMDGNTVIRDRYQPAQNSFDQVTADDPVNHPIPNELNTASYTAGYICFPDVDQRNTASASPITFLRSTSVAVRIDADRLSCNKPGDKVYIPVYHVRTVDDTGSLEGHTNQIDVWKGQGDDSLNYIVKQHGVDHNITCLKILPQ